MHIILTVNASWNAVNFRRGLIDALLADGHNVTVLAPADDRSPELVALGCRYLPLKMDVEGLSPVRDAALVARFRHHFRREAPDVVLSYTIKNNIFGALAARILGIPFIPCVTGLGTAFLSGAVLESMVNALYRISFASVSAVIFQNQDDLDLFLKKGLVKPAQTRLVPGSGIDLKWFSPAPVANEMNPPVFLVIARLLRDKGILEFVEAARIVKKEYPDASFRLLGPIGSKNRTAINADTVADWKRGGIVDYLGSSKDVRPHIAKADCVVLPSYREGAPRTLIEAAAMARPLITTDVAGCRSVVEDGENGFLCEVRNGASLADACKRFINLTPAEKDEMGKAGRRKMEREFDQELVFDEYRRVLAEVGVNDALPVNAGGSVD